jgi:hypothetical protein
LWNVDKHRRLHFTVWWPDDIYWVSAQGDDYGWIPGRPPWADGAVIGTIIAAEGVEPIPAENVTATFELRMTEDGVNGTGIADALAGFYGSLTRWTFPRAFQVYENELRKATQS